MASERCPQGHKAPAERCYGRRSHRPKSGGPGPRPTPRASRAVGADPGRGGAAGESGGERWRAFVLLAAYSSLRWSELVALRVSRLDVLRCRIRVEVKVGGACH